jgi:K+-transporting ATPase A subunit
VTRPDHDLGDLVLPGARTKATLDTAAPTFAAFLLGVIVIVGGLIYFSMLILGPIGERIVG